MYLAVAQEARILQARNHAQHARLLTKLQMILKAHQVVGIRAQIFLAQLYYRIGHPSGARIVQARPASSDQSAAYRVHGAQFPQSASSSRNNSASPNRAPRPIALPAARHRKPSYSSRVIGQLM